MNRSSKSSPAFLAVLLAAVSAHAAGEHPSDMVVGSSLDGGGRLVVEYPFEERSIVPASASVLPGLFTSEDPGFLPAVDEPLEGIYALDLPTTVGLEMVAVDDNLQVQLGASVLALPGDAAVIGTHDDADPELSGLHTHPQFLLSLAAPQVDGFAEGRFFFRLYDDGGLYDDSDVHSLVVSNGYLPALEAPTSAQLACRSAVAKAVRKLGGEAYRRVAACLDEALLQSALATPAAAAPLCGANPLEAGSLAARLDAAAAKALAGVERACGTLGDASTPFTASAVKAHLGMVSCRSQEVAGAAYGEARAALEEVLGAAGGDGTCSSGTCASGVLAGVDGCTGDDDCSVEQAIDTMLPCLETAAAHEEE